MMKSTVSDRLTQVLYDKKWRKFLKRARLFKHLPFVDFVFAAGSMAIGNVNKDSDFDVIVSVRRGRIFTARFFAVLAFGFLGWRRTKLSHRERAADKICLNHFLTEKSWRLSPPYHSYWRILYKNLVPIFGARIKILDFWSANQSWLNSTPKFQDDLRYSGDQTFWTGHFLEFILNGQFGNWFEQYLRKIQIKRIEKSLKSDPPGYKPRVKYSDEELEFHPDTRRIEEFAPRE